jgi:hypothetical protein
MADRHASAGAETTSQKLALSVNSAFEEPPMKAAEMFNECHARYRGLHEWLDDSLGQMRALDLDSPSAGYQWRPERSRACEYVADFERIGRHALKRPEWKGRLKLFEMYFLGGTDYRRAISLVGVAEGTFDYWLQEVKKAAGREFSRTGLYPPSHYFQSTHANLAAGRKAR